MKKDLGVVQAVYPMPVLIVAAYDEDGKVNAMNAAWGMICNSDRIALFIDEDHKTTQNILKTKAFTVSLADRAHMDAADFFGIATGNKNGRTSSSAPATMRQRASASTPRSSRNFPW